MIEHVHVKTAKPFGDVAAALEARMGKFDPSVYEQLQKGADAEVIRARLEKMAGPSSFMLSDGGSAPFSGTQVSLCGDGMGRGAMRGARTVDFSCKAGLVAIFFQSRTALPSADPAMPMLSTDDCAGWASPFS